MYPPHAPFSPWFSPTGAGAKDLILAPNVAAMATTDVQVMEQVLNLMERIRSNGHDASATTNPDSPDGPASMVFEMLEDEWRSGQGGNWSLRLLLLGHERRSQIVKEFFDSPSQCPNELELEFLVAWTHCVKDGGKLSFRFVWQRPD